MATPSSAPETSRQSFIGLALRALLVSALFSVWATYGAEPKVPGTTTTIYAEGVPSPAQIDVGADGSLFVGNAQANSVRISRVTPGGLEVQGFGSPVVDPDSVVVDTVGALTAPGSLLVGGEPSSAGGIIWTYKPDGTALPLVGPSAAVGNPSSLRIDSRNRLVYINYTAKTVVVISRGFAGALEPFNLISAQIASDPIEMVFDQAAKELVLLSRSGTKILRFDLDGQLLSTITVDLKTDGPLEIGRGPFWGNAIYSVDKAGNLVTVGLDGSVRVVGSGFGSVNFMNFSASGVLYLSDSDGNRIFSIDPALRASVRVSRIAVRFNTEASRKYKVLYQSDLPSAPAGWRELAQVDGDGSLKTVEDDVGENERRFYRVVQVPQ